MIHENIQFGIQYTPRIMCKVYHANVLCCVFSCAVVLVDFIQTLQDDFTGTTATERSGASEATMKNIGWEYSKWSHIYEYQHLECEFMFARF